MNVYVRYQQKSESSEWIWMKYVVYFWCDTRPKSLILDYEPNLDTDSGFGSIFEHDSNE